MGTATFDTRVGKLYGIKGAIVLNKIFAECEKNMGTDLYYKPASDGKYYYWFPFSMTDFNNEFPFMTKTAIKRVLYKLLEEGLILIEHFNKENFDMTNWYAITEKGEKVIRG